MDSQERRAFAEIERSVRRDDPLVRRLRRIGLAVVLGGTVAALAGLGSALGGFGILTALAGWAFAVAAPTVADRLRHRW